MLVKDKGSKPDSDSKSVAEATCTGQVQPDTFFREFS